MPRQIVTKSDIENQSISAEQIELIKSQLCHGATDDELRLFLYQCKRTGLDPLNRQIYAVRRWSSAQRRKVMSIQVSIDGFRLIAERTGNYGGQTTPEWCAGDGLWKDVWIPSSPPTAARVGVWRTNFKEPTYGVAKFSSYAVTNSEGNLNEFWSKMPEVMIAKVAEALALRKAFPQELSGLYTSEEMEQANELSIMERQKQREEESLKHSPSSTANEQSGPQPSPEDNVRESAQGEPDIDQINMELEQVGKRKVKKQ